LESSALLAQCDQRRNQSDKHAPRSTNNYKQSCAAQSDFIISCDPCRDIIAEQIRSEAMSVYQPDPKSMSVVKRSDGWYAVDKFGVYDGPYKTAIEAWTVIGNLKTELEERFAR
jgi:hypothetical protein